MGPVLAKPVMTQLEERYGNVFFRCGSCCINGYRDSMEDAHIVHLKDNWGFFGVFDGHVNDACSQYLETAWKTVLEKESVPMSDDRLKEIGLDIDQKWMDSGREGGSTGTYFCAIKENDVVHLQVGNVGDSRVIVCKNGRMEAMTDDHKPSNDSERERIERFGGRVENNRVDGSLAVSRAYGDRDYKNNFEGGQLEQKVIALADVTHVDLAFNKGDFAVLCCDGVFESEFTNEEVVEFVKMELEDCNDLAEVAGKVCREAVARGSRDNISCVIVQFTNGEDYSKEPHVNVVPGGFYLPHNGSFRRVYETMASKGGLTVEVALERRYDFLKAHENENVPEYSEELQNFKGGPPDSLRGAERTKWFLTFFCDLAAERSLEGRSEQLQRIQLLQQQVGVPLPILLSLIQPDSP